MTNGARTLTARRSSPWPWRKETPPVLARLVRSVRPAGSRAAEAL